MRISQLAVLGLGLLGLAGWTASCSQQSANNPQSAENSAKSMEAAEESAIRATDAKWVQAVAAKDPDQTASFYADEASLMAPGAPLATGKDAIRKTWAGLMGAPGFSLTFAPTKIEVSKSGDLGYELGEYELTTNDKKGKPQTSKAKYVVVWGKQGDGTWKALVDAPTTTQ